MLKMNPKSTEQRTCSSSFCHSLTPIILQFVTTLRCSPVYNLMYTCVGGWIWALLLSCGYMKSLFMCVWRVFLWTGRSMKCKGESQPSLSCLEAGKVLWCWGWWGHCYAQLGVWRPGHGQRYDWAPPPGDWDMSLPMISFTGNTKREKDTGSLQLNNTVQRVYYYRLLNLSKAFFNFNWPKVFEDTLIVIYYQEIKSKLCSWMHSDCEKKQMFTSRGRCCPAHLLTSLNTEKFSFSISQWRDRGKNSIIHTLTRPRGSTHSFGMTKPPSTTRKRGETIPFTAVCHYRQIWPLTASKIFSLYHHNMSTPINIILHLLNGLASTSSLLRFFISSTS